MLTKVVIGPTPNPELSKDAIQNLFAVKGHTKVVVETSSIPYGTGKRDHQVPNLAGVLPVVSLLLGYGMKYLEDRIQHNRTLERERETRAALRKDAFAERRSQFQRQTLLDLQPALLDLG